MPPHLTRALERCIARRRPPLAGIDAADLRQEALLAWWQATQHYDPRRGVPLVAYAWPRVLGQVADQCRQATHRGAMTYWGLGTWEPTQIASPREVWLWRRVNRLPRRLRYVMIRRYWSGWEFTGIARRLDVSPSRVRHLHQTALRHLRRQCVLDLLEVL